jgi:hypothetical protein
VKRFITSVLLVVTAVAMMGAEGCQKEGTSPPPTSDRTSDRGNKAPPPNPNVVTYKVKIHAYANRGVSPYEVTIEARSVGNPKEGNIIGPVLVAGGSYDTTLDYNKGRQVYISVMVKTSRAGSQGDAYCEIRDGVNVGTAPLVGRTAHCILVTNRG